jgi:uncharacterized protein YcnI
MPAFAPTCFSSSLRRDHLEISVEDLKSIFDPVIDEIVALIKAQLDAVPDCKFVFLVGGFAQSPYLVNRVKATFPNREDAIFSPPDPGAAVCQGAVLYGIDPLVFGERLSKKTYGVACSTHFKNGDPEHLKFLNPDDGLYYTRDRFMVYARIDEKMDVNKEISYTFVPMCKDQNRVKVALYSSDEKDPKFIRDVGVKLEGYFCVDLLPAPGVETRNKEIEVRFKFAGSTIEVTGQGTNFDSGTPVKASIHFERHVVLRDYGN